MMIVSFIPMARTGRLRLNAPVGRRRFVILKLYTLLPVLSQEKNDKSAGHKGYSPRFLAKNRLPQIDSDVAWAGYFRTKGLTWHRL